MNRGFGPVQMSPKPEHHLNVSEREHQQLQHPISHSSIQSLPVPASAPASTTTARFHAPLPALQESPRYSPTTSSGYETHLSTSSAASTSLPSYTPFSNGFQPTSFPASATSNSYSYTLTADSRPRIPSIQSPTSVVMAPHNRSTSGGTKSVSPSLEPSVRSQYATSTPGLGRHLPSRPSQPDMLASPHSPMTPSSAVSPTMGAGGLTSPAHDHTSNGLGGVNSSAGPPLSETQLFHHLSSADGHIVRPEIQARVDKGFFLSDRDWTCYRRNYFSVICSYSLMPSTYSLPLYLRRSPTSQPEHILSFAMCISAVVDAPGGKTVELVQHTPKRDKGPQHKPAKIKLSPQPAGGMTFTGANTSPVMQQPQTHPSQTGGLDHDFATFPQQAQQQHQQHIAVFDRIQFKSATANNGKRRAAQQYYHLIVELYADVGNAASSAPGQPSTPGSENGWVKIACRISAPMVVRGRSPGHYADERRASSTSSPGGGNAGGNPPGAPHPPPHTSSGQGFMGQDGLSGPDPGAPTQGMMQRVASPSTSAVQQQQSHLSSHNSPATPYDTPPIDPGLDDVPTPLSGTYPPYHYMGSTTLYESAHLPPPHSVDSGFESHSYQGDRKTEHPLETSSSQFEMGVSQYVPKSMTQSEIKRDFAPPVSAPWLGSGATVGREQRYNPHTLYPSCGRYEGAETSKGVFPDISTL